MDDKEVQRLRRLFLGCFLITLLLVVGIVSYFSYRLKDVNNQLLSLKTPLKQTILVKEKPIPGMNGVDGHNGSNGKPGAPGTDGTNGSNGQNVTADQIATAVTAYLQANPPSPGPPGATGPAGLAVFIQTDPITGVLECKHATDTVWQPISECSQ